MGVKTTQVHDLRGKPAGPEVLQRMSNRGSTGARSLFTASQANPERKVYGEPTNVEVLLLVEVVVLVTELLLQQIWRCC